MALVTVIDSVMMIIIQQAPSVVLKHSPIMARGTIEAPWHEFALSRSDSMVRINIRATAQHCQAYVPLAFDSFNELLQSPLLLKPIFKDFVCIRMICYDKMKLLKILPLNPLNPCSTHMDPIFNDAPPSHDELLHSPAPVVPSRCWNKSTYDVKKQQSNFYNFVCIRMIYYNKTSLLEILPIDLMHNSNHAAPFFTHLILYANQWNQFSTTWSVFECFITIKWGCWKYYYLAF